MNDCGFPVEEYEIQFIDGESITPNCSRPWASTSATFLVNKH